MLINISIITFFIGYLNNVKCMFILQRHFTKVSKILNVTWNYNFKHTTSLRWKHTKSKIAILKMSISYFRGTSLKLHIFYIPSVHYTCFVLNIWHTISTKQLFKCIIFRRPLRRNGKKEKHVIVKAMILIPRGFPCCNLNIII